MASIFFIGIGIIFLMIVISKVKRKRFFEKESFLWVVGSICLLFLAIFPGIISYLSDLVGIEYPPSLLFFIATIFILYLLFRQSEYVSLLREQVKELGQRIVVLEKVIEEEKQNEKKIDEKGISEDVQ
ncbi:MAG: DUF2304 domain-containing protein [Clostridium sp.]|uniref:DUF2304 domain-containing protein n=1 Tax=Clostridium sp. TaxID=1506 RepID=UPI00290699BB|nr:DUF2304 domain-containing protein [Clostridium sp.]MDU4937990.1 DUF2304 domain-containing protein [Clostridium sp.]